MQRRIGKHFRLWMRKAGSRVPRKTCGCNRSRRRFRKVLTRGGRDAADGRDSTRLYRLGEGESLSKCLWLPSFGIFGFFLGRGGEEGPAVTTLRTKFDPLTLRLSLPYFSSNVNERPRRRPPPPRSDLSPSVSEAAVRQTLWPPHVGPQSPQVPSPSLQTQEGAEHQDVALAPLLPKGTPTRARAAFRRPLRVRSSLIPSLPPLHRGGVRSDRWTSSFPPPSCSPCPWSSSAALR